MARRTPSAQWAEHTRQATRRWTPGNLREASQTFDRLLSPTEQMKVAQELVETRAAELCRAYPNVVDVSFGYRRRRDRRSGRPMIVRSPCIRFVVEGKWKRVSRARADDQIPKRLFAYWTIGAERKLCAIPTDVEDAAAFARVTLHAATAGLTVAWESEKTPGALTCILKRAAGGPDFGLSCRHVLSLADAFHPTPTWGARVHLRVGESAAEVGRTRAIAGSLLASPERSFDAQLFEITRPDALREALAGLTLSGYVESFGDVPDTFSILAPDRRIPAQKLGFVFDRPLYRVGRLGFITHLQLIEYEAAARPGDSGSPVVTNADGGVLLGMHIAGNPDQRLGYMIPAWQLFDPANYNGAANSERWQVANL